MILFTQCEFASTYMYMCALYNNAAVISRERALVYENYGIYGTVY